MKKIFITILICCSCSAVFSQSDWFWQNPLPQGNNLNWLNVLDENNAVSISSNDIVKTIDGENWNVISTGFPGINKSLSMLDQNTGYILISPNILAKTTNGGNNWNFVCEVDTTKYPLSVKFISAEIGFLFYPNGQLNNRGIRILRTSNGGANWNVVMDYTDLEIYNAYFPNLSIGYASGSKYLGTGSNYKLKFFKTTDGGISWDSIPNSITLNPKSLYFLDENTGYIGGSGSVTIFKTTTGGISWDVIPFTAFGVSQLQFLNYNTGFAMNDFGYIHKTTNQGANWIALNSYPQSVRQFWFANSNIAYGVGDGGLIIKTFDGGVNWTNYTKGINNVQLEDVRFADANTGFIAGEGGTILKTINGGVNWDLIQFPQIEWFTSISNINSAEWFVASFYQNKILKTTNTGLTWDTLHSTPYGITRLEFVNALTGFGVSKYGMFFKTTDGGLTYNINNTFTGENWSLDFLDENTGYAGGVKTRKTTNGGMTWDTVSIFGQYFFSADIQFLNYKTGYIAGYKDGSGNNRNMLLKTTNAGLDWQTLISGNLRLIDICFLNERIGFVSSWYEILKTTNGGINWSSIRTCSNNSLSSIFFTDSLNGYCAGDNGTVIKSTNGGGTVGVIQSGTEVPESFFLYQNYPNPFNPTTVINYDLRVTSYVTMKVYDISGKEVDVLVNEIKNVGKHSVEFNGSNLSSGIYFYRIELSSSEQNLVQSRKMILIK